jgi:hypothetical protein
VLSKLPQNKNRKQRSRTVVSKHVIFIEATDSLKRSHHQLRCQGAIFLHIHLLISLTSNGIKGAALHFDREIAFFSLNFCLHFCSCLSEFDLPGAGNLLGGSKPGSDSGEFRLLVKQHSHKTNARYFFAKSRFLTLTRLWQRLHLIFANSSDPFHLNDRCHL